MILKRVGIDQPSAGLLMHYLPVVNDCFRRRTRHSSGESTVEAVPDAAAV